MGTATITEAAKRLGVSMDTIRRRVRKGEISAQRDNHGQWRLELPDNTAPAPQSPAYVPSLAPPYEPMQPLDALPMQPPGPPDMALVDALLAQVDDLVRRLDRMEVGHHAERDTWQEERKQLLELVRTLVVPRPPLLVQLVDAVRRRVGPAPPP